LLEIYKFGYNEKLIKLEFSRSEIINLIDVYSTDGKDGVKDFIFDNQLKMGKEKYFAQKILDEENERKNLPPFEIKNIEHDGDKLEFSVTNNTTFNVSYIKFDIKIYDVSKNVIDTDWTNWSGNLHPGDSAKIDTYITDGSYVSIEVSEIIN